MPDRLVYSTDSGRITHCPTCGQLYKLCRCDQPTSPISAPFPKKSDGFVRIMRDRKQRGGKTVTVISNLPPATDLAGLAQQLKKYCGSGGTIKDNTIEIQGDHLEKVQGRLSELGYKVKRVGG